MPEASAQSPAVPNDRQEEEEQEEEEQEEEQEEEEKEEEFDCQILIPIKVTSWFKT